MEIRKNRRNNETRAVKIHTNYLEMPDGSALIEFGRTRVVCAVSLEERVPPFLVGKNEGWLTAEYSLMPGSTRPRADRESSKGKISGRTHEIQRLIGRSLRSVVNMKALGSRTVWVDCDVLSADGGTRTAAITGAYVALVLAGRQWVRRGLIAELPITQQVAAVSVGTVAQQLLLDLEYAEDSIADVDMNVVMLGNGELIEVQGTAENRPFSRSTLDQMMDLAQSGIQKLFSVQSEALA
ncbi:MAG: ribonuclease PH [Myxococcales bacterium]|nr:ribonuclease PH [Myxococcales bacterium]